MIRRVRSCLSPTRWWSRGLVLAALVLMPVAPVGTVSAESAESAGPVVAVSPLQTRKRQPSARKSPRAKKQKKPTTRTKRGSTKTRSRARAPIVPVLRHTTPRGAGALTADLTALLGSRTRNGEWGAMVVSITRGDTLFAHGADSKLVPASTMKLFTAAVALDKLGAEHTFSTDVLREGAMGADGTLTGNLILRGDGDPSLSPRFVRGGPAASMTLLAQLVAGAGIKRVRGAVLGAHAQRKHRDRGHHARSLRWCRVGVSRTGHQRLHHHEYRAHRGWRRHPHQCAARRR